MEYVPFKDEFLQDASILLANRQQQERFKIPELPVEFEDPAYSLKALEAEWSKPNTRGFAAIEDEKLVGYVIGYPSVDDYRGRCAFINYPSMAIADNQSEELYRVLYSLVAEEWVNKGYFNHFVFVPAGNQATIESWFKLGFTYQQVYSLLDLRTIGISANPNTDIKIRKGVATDSDELKKVAEWISTHQAKGPAWNPIMPETLEEIREGYSEIVSDEEASIWLATVNQQIAGFQAYWPQESSETNMIIPKKCIELKVAASDPNKRKQGIGSLLTTYCFSEIKAMGYDYCLTDWHMLNLQSSTFWPKMGFKPVMHRLIRKVDERIAWANGSSLY